MWSRLKYLASFFAVMWAFFILQKPVFMLANATQSYGIGQWLSVMWHGAGLDATTAGYLTIVPFLLTVASVWFRHMQFRRILLPYYIFVAIITSLIFVADTSLFPFWESKLDATVFVYIDSPKNAMASVSTVYVVWRVVMIAALAAFISFLLTLLTPRQLPKINMIGSQMIASVCALPVAGVLFVVIRGGIHVSTANVGDAYFCNDQFLNLSAVNPAFNLFASTERQTVRYEDEFNFYDEARRAQLMQGLYPKTDTATTPVLNTRRPNILVIFMEGFGATMIERLGGEPGVAPNLERLADEGIFFSRIFANSFRTDRGTVCAFSGFPGLPTLSIMKVASLCQTMPCIARSLAKAGYTTDFLYGGDINFTNMQGYLRSGGFEKLTSQDDFAVSDRQMSKWGVRDDLTFERLYQMLSTRKQQKPWFTAFLTLSSHEPFKVPFHKFADDHFNSFAYTDDCIGKFIDRFRRTPQWKNTLVILLPDHGIPYPKKGERFAPRNFRIPMIWTGGAVKAPMTVEKIMNQTDLAATLLAQLGISHADYDYSRNVLSADYTYPFAFYSFVNGFCLLDNSGVSVYDNASNKVFFSVAPQADSTRVARGKAILQTLYDDIGARNSKRFSAAGSTK